MIESHSSNQIVNTLDSSSTTALGQSLHQISLGAVCNLPSTTDSQLDLASIDSNKKTAFKTELLQHSCRIEANHSPFNLKFFTSPRLRTQRYCTRNIDSPVSSHPKGVSELQMSSDSCRNRIGIPSTLRCGESVQIPHIRDNLSSVIQHHPHRFIPATPPPAKPLPAPHSNKSDPQEIVNCDWKSIKVEEFTLLATSDRRTAQEIQQALLNSNSNSALIELIRKAKRALVCDKYGCHIIRDALGFSEAISREVIDMVINNLHYFSCFESSSRVLQALAKTHFEIAEHYLVVFENNWRSLSKKISAVFLFSVCLESVGPSSYIVVRISHLLADIFTRTKEKTSKQLKRVLVSFLESCRDSDLDKFYLILGFRASFADKMRDKYMVYIFLKF